MQGLVQVSEQDWGYLLRMSGASGTPPPLKQTLFPRTMLFKDK
jgi:hypothetical protein